MKRSSPQLQKEGGGSELTHHCSALASTWRERGVEIHLAISNKIHFAIWEKYILQFSSQLQSQKEGRVSELTHHCSAPASTSRREGGVQIHFVIWNKIHFAISKKYILQFGRNTFCNPGLSCRRKDVFQSWHTTSINLQTLGKREKGVFCWKTQVDF